MIVPRRVLGGPGYQAPSDRVQVATVGYINGMGTSNTNAVGKVADVVALIGTIDIVLGEVDR